MMDARKGWLKGLPGLTMLGSGLVVLWLAALPLPVLAQSWPSDAGPNSDILGFTLRQFNQMAPPPVEAGARAERAVPNMPQTDLIPSGMVDVGMPMITRRPLFDSSQERATRSPRASDTRRRNTRRQDVRYNVRGATPMAQRSRSREQELARELADRDRQILEMRRQIEDDRRGTQESRGIGSALFGINPASAATVTPR